MSSTVTVKIKINNESILCGVDMKKDHTVSVSVHLLFACPFKCIICEAGLPIECYCDGIEK